MILADDLREDAIGLADDLRAVLTETDRVVVAERLLDLAGLTTRALAGEDVNAAIASRRRSLDGYRTAAGVAAGEAFLARALRRVAQLLAVPT